MKKISPEIIRPLGSFSPRSASNALKRLFNSIKFDKIAALLIAVLTAALVMNPRIYTASIVDGFGLFARAVLPSLFPFLVLSKMFLSVGGFEGAEKTGGKIFEKLYGVPSVGVSVFLTALLGGYPVGAKMTADMYLDGALTKKEARTAAILSSVASPPFIFGFVGGLFPHAAVILICHWLSALAAGWFFRAKEKNEKSDISVGKKQNLRVSVPRENTKNLCVGIDKKNGSIPRKKGGNLLADAITSAISATLLVGGFIALFYMLSEMFLHSLLFSLLSEALTRVTENEKISGAALLGFIEMTRGVSEVAASGISTNFSVPLVCFFVSFGGLSVTLQSLAFLKPVGIKVFDYIKMKAVQAVFAAFFSTAAMLILNFKVICLWIFGF
jgi:sporulation integral membrane protein YlbJ